MTAHHHPGRERWSKRSPEHASSTPAATTPPTGEPAAERHLRLVDGLDSRERAIVVDFQTERRRRLDELATFQLGLPFDQPDDDRADVVFCETCGAYCTGLTGLIDHASRCT